MMELIMPKSKDELFKMIDRHVKVADRKELALAEDLSAYHFGLGLWIRNRFVYPSNGEVGRLLVEDGMSFTAVADVVSDDILKAYQAYLYKRYGMTSSSTI